ncbi:hypothetical protein COOONC_04983 [Cooperia oncophora]
MSRSVVSIIRKQQAEQLYCTQAQSMNTLPWYLLFITARRDVTTPLVCPWLKYDCSQMTLYADGGKIPFPNRRDHPPHIPTGTAGFEVFTFYPTYEEFKDFKGCIQKIEAVGAHRRSGICKIVAPEGWTPRPTKGKYAYKDDQVEHFVIQSPVKESVARQNEAILKSNHVYKKSMLASEYRKLAQSSKYRNPCPDLQGKDIEIQYFKNMFTSHPIYGADTEGSFYDEGVNEFNMKKLETILDETKDATGGKVIKGVNSVYLYFGMYGASFAWHVEDMELYSINFLHHGSPKYWFAIPPEASPRFERLMRQQFPAYDRQCKIVAPEGWTPRPTKGKYAYKDDQVEHFVIQSPVKESVARQNEAILKSNHVYKKSMLASEYRKLAQSSKYRNPCPDLQGKDIEIQYFKNMFTSHPIYGADTEGSFYDEGVNEFNMKKLETILDETKDATGGKVGLVFLHTVYSENMAFMRHKNFMVLPSLLDKHKIPYGTMIQYPNEFIITFPHGYHMGFNLGYNIAESTNFATDRWIDFGKNAVLCKCRSDMVEIDMTPFMKKYRRDNFEKWYSYWYLPKPTAEVPLKKKKKKREEAGSIESFSNGGAKRRRTSEGSEITETVSSHGSRSSETTESQLSLRESWKHRITMLWSNEPVNFFAERTFNQAAARIWPYCAVCQYFQPIHMSPRLAFGLCFAKDPRRLPNVDPTEDRLLTCSNCCVTVHPSCYGGQSAIPFLGCSPLPKNRNDVAIRGTSCHLCELRGGALLPCRAGADILLCAYSLCIHSANCFQRREQSFVLLHSSSFKANINQWSAVRTTCQGIMFSRWAMNMKHPAFSGDPAPAHIRMLLCGHTREGLEISAMRREWRPCLGACHMCTTSWILVRKAHLSSDNCHDFDRHQQSEEMGWFTVGPLMDVNLGDIVIAWMDGGSRVRQGRVERFVLRTLLTIDFEDGSVSENTLPSDIVQCGCIRQQGCRDGQHQPGSRVKVQWNDGELYDGYYRCISKTIEYTVVFANGTSARLPRADLYGADDVVPAEVRRRLRKSH